MADMRGMREIREQNPPHPPRAYPNRVGETPSKTSGVASGLLKAIT